MTISFSRQFEIAHRLIFLKNRFIDIFKYINLGFNLFKSENSFHVEITLNLVVEFVLYHSTHFENMIISFSKQLRIAYRLIFLRLHSYKILNMSTLFFIYE